MERITYLSLLCLLFSLFACDSGGSSSASLDFELPNVTAKPTYEEAIVTLQQKEAANPTAFLETGGTYRRTLGGKWLINGTLANSATVTTYKDVEIAVSYYTKTKTLLGKKHFTIFEYFQFGKTNTFQIRDFGPKGTAKLDWEVVSAYVAN